MAELNEENQEIQIKRICKLLLETPEKMIKEKSLLSFVENDEQLFQDSTACWSRKRQQRLPGKADAGYVKTPGNIRADLREPRENMNMVVAVNMIRR